MIEPMSRGLVLFFDFLGPAKTFMKKFIVIFFLIVTAELLGKTVLQIAIRVTSKTRHSKRYSTTLSSSHLLRILGKE